MFTNEQRTKRRAGLGASEVAAVLGLCPFRTPWDVFASKTGLSEDGEENDAKTLGHLFEGPILALYEKKNGVSVRTPLPTIQHHKYAWAFATPDGEESNTGVLVQAKNVGRGMAHEWARGLPEYVALQVQWEMACADRQAARVAAVVCGTEYVQFDCHRDDDAIEAMFEVCGAWWKRHIVNKEPLTPDGSHACRSALSARFNRGTGEFQQGTPLVRTLVEEYSEARKRAKQAEEDLALFGNLLCETIGDSQGIVGEDFKVTWKFNSRGLPNYKRIAEELGATPDLIDRHTGAPARVLRVAWTKKGETQQ